MLPASNFACFPPEILGHIFFVLPSGTLTVPSQTYDTLSNVTRTCSTWRAIALHHPHLWNHLNINLSSWSDEGTIHVAGVCLRNSTAYTPHALFVRLHIKRYIDYRASPSGIQAPTFLAPYAHRIQRLSILSPLSLTPLTFPHLTNLEVLAAGWETHIDMCISALLLRSHCEITHLSVGHVPDADWGAILEAAPKLRCLVAEGSFPEEIMRTIAGRKLGAELREVQCTVMLHDFDIFLDMLEARAAGVAASQSADVDENGAIRYVTAKCVDFYPTERPWIKIHALSLQISIDISEGYLGVAGYRHQDKSMC